MVRPLLLAAVALLTIGQANAVCLLGDYSLGAEARRSDLIASGVVTDAHSVPDPEDPEGFAGVVYEVMVQELLKGNAPQVLRIYSENTSSRFPMDVGSSYLLLLYKQDETYGVDSCGNSGLLRDKQAAETVLRSLLSGQ